jgi:hypothetical protein
VNEQIDDIHRGESPDPVSRRTKQSKTPDMAVKETSSPANAGNDAAKVVGLAATSCLIF